MLGGLAAASLAPRAQAQSSDSFVVATYGGLFEQILRKNVIPDFEAKHGVRVVLELGQGTTFLPKLATARRRSPYDVVYVNDDEAALGGSMGAVGAGYVGSDPECGGTLPTVAAAVQGDAAVYDDGVRLPAAVSHRLGGADVMGGFVVDRPGGGGAAHLQTRTGLTFLLIAALLNGGDAANIAPGFAAVKRLKNPKVWRGITQGYGMFQQGEVVAGLMYNHRAQQLVDAGLPVAMVHPKEGVWGQRTGLQIPKTATRPDLSAAWADIALGVDYQAAFAEGLYSPSNAKVPLKQAEKFVTGEARINGLRFPDWDVINPQRDALLDQWNRVVGN